MDDRDLYVGRRLGDGDRAHLDGDHLTTHAVCLGMTGSGKTGLGIVVLEELARRGTPLLVIDLKGDMVNLLLSFPRLDGASFAPWVPAAEIGEAGREAAAHEVAARWREGLAGSGLDGDDVAAVREGVRWQLVTPGVSGRAPLDILPSLAPPADPAALDEDGLRERVNGVVGGLLSLIGRGGDPLTDRDHVLLSSLLLAAWGENRALDLAGLVRAVADPPFDALGALPLDSFYPQKDRMELVLALNTLLASPAFRAWTEGLPLTMESLLGTPGAPQATILSVAHLDERQRRFVLTLVLAELVAWMRRQPASAGLRALLYLDEVQGILPPHPAAPPTKGPLLTLLKQGRAFGVGVWLATQNPVDLDYKAAGNAGVQLIGRLITERDRERALDGLGLGALEDGRDPDKVVAGLGSREFLRYDVRASERVMTFSSRWALSYLRGPVTLAEMAPLVTAGGEGSDPSPARPRSAPAAAASPPLLATDMEQVFAQDGVPGPMTPWIWADLEVGVRRASLKLDRRARESWRIPIGDDGRLAWDRAAAKKGDLEPAVRPPAGATFPAVAPAEMESTLEAARKDVVAWRARSPVRVLANSRLSCVAAEDESREDFIARCLELADRADDDDQEKARARFERKMATLRRRLEREQDELERDQDQLAARQAEEKLGMVEGLFSVLLGSRSVRSAARKAVSRVRSTATKRRMRHRAEASVVESENEIERLDAQLDDLADEMQDEVDRIAAASQAAAEAVEEIAIRPTRSDVVVRRIRLVWQ